MTEKQQWTREKEQLMTEKEQLMVEKEQLMTEKEQLQQELQTANTKADEQLQQQVRDIILMSSYKSHMILSLLMF